MKKFMENIRKLWRIILGLLSGKGSGSVDRAVRDGQIREREISDADIRKDIDERNVDDLNEKLGWMD